MEVAPQDINCILILVNTQAGLAVLTNAACMDSSFIAQSCTLDQLFGQSHKAKDYPTQWLQGQMAADHGVHTHVLAPSIAFQTRRLVAAML